MFRPVALLACLALASCNAAGRAPLQASTAGTPTALSASQAEIVRATVRRQVSDPGTAQFGQILAARTSRTDITVCGLVDSRTGSGLSAGQTPFIGTFMQNGGFVLSEFARQEGARTAIRSVCRDAGLVL